MQAGIRGSMGNSQERFLPHPDFEKVFFRSYSTKKKKKKTGRSYSTEFIYILTILGYKKSV